MKCPIETRENAELLLEYCARKLDPATTAVLERHIGICPACREFAAGQRALWDALDTWDATPVPVARTRVGNNSGRYKGSQPK